MIPTRPRISSRRLIALATLAAGALVAVAGCGSSSPQAAGSTGTPAGAAAQPTPNTPAGDPCSVISISSLEQITGLTGLAVQNQLGKSTNGCHWGAGASGVAYDMLPMVGSADQMIAGMQGAASGSGGRVSFKKVDLGHGHDGVQLISPGPGAIDLFLPPDRYAAIVVMLPPGSDAGTIALKVAEALSAVSGQLPAAPKR